MIAFLKSWCEGIIVAVILSILIESILPEGNHKKYVKVVIGVYVLFMILNPFLEKFGNGLEIPKEFDLPSVETSNIDPKNIQELYANGIEETLKNQIEEEFEVLVKHLEIVYDENYENIEKITLELEQKGIVSVEKVEIGNTNEKQESHQNYTEVQNYIAQNYNLDQTKILIN